MARSRAAPSWFPQSRDDSVLDLGGVAALHLLLPAYDDMLSGVWLPLFDWTILVCIYTFIYIPYLPGSAWTGGYILPLPSLMWVIKLVITRFFFS